jgi:uncharacterized protein with HEPN domain
MTSERKNKLYLQLISDALQKITAYTRGLSMTDFVERPMVQDAVHMQLLVVGENVKRLSAHYKQAHPQVAWQPIAGLRNLLAHEYENIDVEEIWDAVQNDVPALSAHISALLNSFDDYINRIPYDSPNNPSL